MTKIAEKYGVLDKTISYWCIKWDIETPERGFWVTKKDFR